MPAGEKPQYVGTHYIGVFPFSLSSDFKGAIKTDILHYYSSMAHTEEPLLRLCEQVHRCILSGIHSITVPILDVLLLLCCPPHSMYSCCCAFLHNSCKRAEFLSTDQIPRQARPVEQINKTITFYLLQKNVRMFLFVELLFLRKLPNFARSEPREQLLLAVFVFGSAGPESA